MNIDLQVIALIVIAIGTAANSIITLLMKFGITRFIDDIKAWQVDMSKVKDSQAALRDPPTSKRWLPTKVLNLPLTRSRI